jgi:hypothetical protein
LFPTRRFVRECLIDRTVACGLPSGPRGYVAVMPDEPALDVISGGRDPGHRRAASWRLLAAAAAAVLIAGGIAFRLFSGPSGPVPPSKPQASPPPVALAAPPMLRGTPLRPGGAPGTLLFLGGEELRLLNVREQAPTSLSSVLPDAEVARYPLGPDPAVRQIISVADGIVALAYSHGSADLPDIGDVLFIPVDASGAGLPRIIAWANYMAVAPDHRDVWVEQAGAPWGNGPAGSPAWLVDENGRRLSGVRRLNNQALVAATVRGLLVQSPDQKLALMDSVDGRAEGAGIPADAIIAGTDADHVAWQSPACSLACPLHVTDVRGGPDTQIALPPRTAIDSGDTSDFDPAGQRLAIPLDTTDRRGAITGTYVYVADLSARKLIRVPGAPIPLATLPAVLGAIPAGSSDVVCARWSADGSGLWIVATDGLYFQVGYWTGHGPLRVLQPQSGLAYKFDVPGTGRPAA